MSETVKAAVSQTIDAIAKNPDMAKLLYKSQTRLVKDVLCTAKVRNFEPMAIDEPAPFGGGDTAMSPADLVLVALGTCQEIMYSALASVMDIPLESVSVELKGNLDLHGLLGMGADKGIPPGFQAISYVTTINSPANEETLKQLVDTVESQCPILDTLVRSVSVQGKAVLNGTTEYAAKAVVA